MADWTYEPHFNYPVRREPPPTLITRFTDGTEFRRQKTSVQPRIFQEKHRVGITDLAAMLNFFEARYLVTSFTKVAYDGNDPAFGTTEVTVRFNKAPVTVQISADLWDVTFEFIEVF